MYLLKSFLFPFWIFFLFSFVEIYKGHESFAGIFYSNRFSDSMAYYFILWITSVKTAEIVNFNMVKVSIFFLNSWKCSCSFWENLACSNFLRRVSYFFKDLLYYPYMQILNVTEIDFVVLCEAGTIIIFFFSRNATFIRHQSPLHCRHNYHIGF